MKDDFTNGPWEVHSDYGTPFVFGPGSALQEPTGEDEKRYRSKLVALVYSCDDGSQGANTNLIGAAPELLEALEAIVSFSTPLPCGLLQQACAAINKARGRMVNLSEAAA